MGTGLAEEDGAIGAKVGAIIVGVMEISQGCHW
jgi:hypothetical protein